MAMAMAMAGQAGITPVWGGQAAAMVQGALDAGFAAEDDGRRFSVVQRQWAAVAPASPATPAAD